MMNVERVEPYRCVCCTASGMPGSSPGMTNERLSLLRGRRLAAETFCRRIRRRSIADSIRAAWLNDAAGDAVAGIAGRIGLVVVRLGVNHQRRAVAVEQRIRLALVQGDGFVQHLDREFA